MNLPNLAVVCAVLISSELVLNLAKRSRERGTDKDQFTLPLLWLVISLSVWLALELRARLPAGRLPHPHLVYLIGLIVFAIGLVIRWSSIIYLGRFSPSTLRSRATTN